MAVSDQTPNKYSLWPLAATVQRLTDAVVDVPIKPPGRRPGSGTPEGNEDPAMNLPDQTASNRRTITDAFEAWRDSGTPITGVFAPAMTWRIEGHSVASRDYATTGEFVDEVLTPFARRFSTTDPFRPVEIRGVYADGDTVIVLWRGRGTTVAGTTYENTYAWFMQLSDGQVVDGTAFYDSISFNELWATVTPVERPDRP